MKDFTHQIERMMQMEEHFGVKLESLSAWYSEDSDYSEDNTVKVMGEIQTLNGEGLEVNLELVLSVHDSEGRVIGTGTSSYIKRDQFYCLEIFEISCEVPRKLATKLRLYPKQY